MIERFWMRSPSPWSGYAIAVGLVAALTPCIPALDAVSHDLRTPLSAIIASAESLLQLDVRWSASEQREFLHDIVTEGRWLDRMVRHLLDLSRIEASALRLAPAWHDPQELIEEVVR